METDNKIRSRIETGSGTITLIGTAHVSKESVAEVSAYIREEKPDMVCVEIDKTRYDSMTGQDSWQKLDMIKVIREGKGFLLIANLVLTSFQRRLGTGLGVKPGAEMKAAIETSEEMGIPFSFCDREVQVTLRRAWSCCGLWSKSKLLAALFESAFTNEKLSEEEIENLKKHSELDGMMEELAHYLPEVKATLIDERDYYLASKIWENSQGKSSSVAVLGAGHLNGVTTYLQQFAAEAPDAQANAAKINLIETIPGRSLFSRMAGYLIPALIVLFIVIGLVFADWREVSAGLLRWLVINGTLASAGALLALAHPLAIIVSFFGAPIGTLSPVISVGLFSGIAQAYLRRPRVQDVESLNNDILSLKGIYRNRITHILLVFFLASLGGVVGNVIGFTLFANTAAGFFHR